MSVCILESNVAKHLTQIKIRKNSKYQHRPSKAETDTCWVNSKWWLVGGNCFNVHTGQMWLWHKKSKTQLI